MLLNDDVTMGDELWKEPLVVMDDLELEEPVILGGIEIGVVLVSLILRKIRRFRILEGRLRRTRRLAV